MGEYYSYSGTGMTISRMNEDGEIKQMVDTGTRDRVSMLDKAQVDKMIKIRDDYARKAKALRAKKEKESKVFQERKHYKTGNYVIKCKELNDLEEMVRTYDRTIAKLGG